MKAKGPELLVFVALLALAASGWYLGSRISIILYLPAGIMAIAAAFVLLAMVFSRRRGQ